MSCFCPILIQIGKSKHSFLSVHLWNFGVAFFCADGETDGHDKTLSRILPRECAWNGEILNSDASWRTLFNVRCFCYHNFHGTRKVLSSSGVKYLSLDSLILKMRANSFIRNVRNSLPSDAASRPKNWNCTLYVVFYSSYLQFLNLQVIN